MSNHDHEQPAVIDFPQDDDNQYPQPELEEEDAPEPSPSAGGGQAKKKGTPGWVYIVGGVVFLVVVGAFVGLLIVKKRAQAEASEEQVVMEQVAPQPQILPNAQIASAPAALDPTTGLPVSAAIQPAAAPPVVVPPAVAQQPVAQQAMPAAMPGMVQAAPGVATQQQAPANQPQANAAPTAQQAAPAQPPRQMETQATTEKGLSQDNAEIQRLTKEVAQLKITIQQLKSSSGDSADDGADVPRQESKAATKPKKVVAVSKPKPVVAKTVAQKQGKPEPSFEERLAAGRNQEPETSANYTITGMIGSRVFVAKRMADGSEVEMSAVPGERIEGRVVSRVDPASRCIQFESGKPLCRK